MFGFKKTFLLVCFIITLSSAVDVFASGQKEPVDIYSGKTGRITVYISGPATMISKLEKAFEKEHGDVLDIVQMGCGPLRQRVWSEMEAGQIKADVFWGSDPLIYIALDNKGALEAFTPEGIEAVRDEFLTGSSYTLINERYIVVIYNSKKLTEERIPSSYADLLDSGLKGSVVQGDPSQSSTALAIVAGLWDIHGRNWDFYRGLAANNFFLSKKNSDVPSKIQEGEFDAGVAPHDAVLRLQNKAKKEGYPTPLAICWPEEGPLAIQRPIAISRNTARPEVNEQIARSFVSFMISKQAQKITTMFGFASVRKDLPLTAGIPGDLEIRRVDWDYLASHENDIRDGFKALFQ